MRRMIFAAQVRPAIGIGVLRVVLKAAVPVRFALEALASKPCFRDYVKIAILRDPGGTAMRRNRSKRAWRG